MGSGSEQWAQIVAGTARAGLWRLSDGGDGLGGREQLLSPAAASSRPGGKRQHRQAHSEQAVAARRRRRVAWWLVGRPDRLRAGQQALLARMEQASPACGRL